MTQILTRRRFLTGLIAATGLTGLYTWRIEPNWVELIRRDLPIANLPPGLAGKILVQLSDIHIGTQVTSEERAALEASLAKATFTGLVMDLLATGDRRRLNGAFAEFLKRLADAVAAAR